MGGQITLLAGNDPVTARTLASRAAELGRSLGVIDIEMTGLGLEGLALVFEGEVAAGMARLDEATTAAVAGEVSVPNAIGATCCYLVYACERVWDFERAVQWCHKGQDFCRQAHWVSLFALCRTHHAMVLLWQGAWSEAEGELQAATSELEATWPGSRAQASIRLADLRRRQGRIDEAESLLAQVGFDRHAMLGLAAVAADRGRPTEALNLLQRFVRQIPTENRTDRAAAFELIVRAHAELGQPDHAEAALVELEALAARLPTAPMRASAALARGVVAGAVSEHAKARRHFEDAVDLFQASGAPFETAHARLELARQLAALGHEELAAREARTAHDACSSLGAALLARRAAARSRRLRGTAGIGDRQREPVFRLTARELEILRLVAQGLSNPQIAEVLVLSEHTVRRHLANILAKLAFRHEQQPPPSPPATNSSDRMAHPSQSPFRDNGPLGRSIGATRVVDFNSGLGPSHGRTTLPKIIFILQRKAGTTPDECLARWTGDQHTAIVSRIPGLTRWTQNWLILPTPGKAPCDGIGELWFESDELLRRALNSPEMGAAVDDAKSFLDMEKTSMIEVEEKTVVDRVGA